jgi:hypothetical protein
MGRIFSDRTTGGVEKMAIRYYGALKTRAKILWGIKTSYRVGQVVEHIHTSFEP